MPSRRIASLDRASEHAGRPRHTVAALVGEVGKNLAPRGATRTAFPMAGDGIDDAHATIL